MRVGWQVHADPGELYLTKGNEQLNPFEVVTKLSDGTLSPESWKQACQSYGIEHTLLVDDAGEAARGTMS